MTETNGEARNGQAPTGEVSRDRFLHEIGEIVGNLMLSRSQLWSQLLDKRRRIDEECDYPPTGIPIGVELYKELYEREAIAARVVEVMPMETWQSTPQVVDGKDISTETDFEKAWDELGKSLAPGGGTSWHREEHGSVVWEYLRRLDILSGIGQFGVMLLGIDDGLNLQDPVDGSTVAVGVSNCDSPMSESEEQQLRQLGSVTKRMWTHNYRPMVEDGFGGKKEGTAIPQFREIPTKPLSEEEVAVVNHWKDCREVHNTFKRISALFTSPPTLDQVLNVATDQERPHVERWVGLAEHARAVWNGLPTENKAATHFQDLLPGTDRQYFEAGSLGMGMSQAIGSGALGTDKQYLGVQFGPSQKAVDEPVKKKHKLLFVRCYDETLVQVVRYEWNVMNPRFGMPVMYRITLNDLRQIHSGIGLPLATVFVHWTRVIHVADNLTNSEIFGTPRMQQVLNRCLDLRKLYASGAEGYWQSCFAAISLETHPQAGGDVRIDEKATSQMLTDFRNRLRRDLLLEGMSAKTLPPQVIDGSPFITSQIEAICIKIPCPKRVFMGSERGELASSQDDAQWNDVIRARQNLHVTPRIIVPFINRLILLGVLPEPEDGYKIDWPDLDSLNDKDKATVALAVTQAIAAFVAGNGEAVMTIEDFLVKVFMGLFDEDEVKAMVKKAEKQQEEDLADKQDIADQHGMIPEPPEGFQHPPAPPPPQSPIKVKAGEKLVPPASIQPPKGVTTGTPPTGNPPTGKPPTANEAAEYIEAKIRFDEMLEVTQ